MEIYTIGHSNYEVERLFDMLRKFHIDCVVDIRGIPYSRYNIQFNKDAIQYSLTRAGFKYVYMGNEFGANRLLSKESYNKEGYADFNKVAYEKIFKYGVERLKNGCKKGYKIVLLGAMQDPLRCHRSILLGRELTMEKFKVKHILDDYTIIDQKEIEERLLDKYFPNRNQITIDSLFGSEKTKEELVEEAYKKANKEIGIRVEKLE